uniref:uncharacterized protein LOC120338226 n=1 Tax=Styela clava TaxID=7725 RepID=UPI001939493D|nr:uncharacterized protein LOC120338226 [Styela clava]
MEAKRAKLDEEACHDTSEESDFTIKVGKESFPVHKNRLIIASDYFQAMLTHDTKERQQGVVHMKEVEPDGVKFCIEFIYTGATTVTMETMPNLLTAARIMQLDVLIKNCVGVLEENLKAENCISVLKLARTHSFADLEGNALELFRENYKFEEFGDFAELEKSDFVERISDFRLRNELAWEVIINWIKLNVKERSKDIFEFVKLLDWKYLPTGTSALLKNLWSEPIFQNSKPCKKFLFRRIFSDLDELKHFLDVDNFFLIRSMCIAYQDVTKQGKNIIDEYLKMNIVQLFEVDQSLSLTKDEFFAAFLDHDTSCLCSEELFWKIAVKWCKHDPTRRTLFPKLMEAIRFDRLDKSFIATSVRNETLLTESQECVKIFIDAVNSQILKSNDASYIAVLYPDGKIFAKDLKYKSWHYLPDAPKGNFMQIFSLHDRLCLFTDGKLWYFSEKDVKWVERAQLTDRCPRNAKIVTIDDRAYIVGPNLMCCYDSDTNKWDETLPTTDLDIRHDFCVVRQDNDILVINGNKQCQDFNTQSKTWSKTKDFQKISKFSSAAYHQSTSYIVGLSHQTDRWSETYVKTSRYNILGAWEDIKNIPVDLNSSQGWLFTTGENLILFASGGIYVYHELSNSWVVVANLPKYNTCGKKGLGQVKQLDPNSLCSFKGNLD